MLKSYNDSGTIKFFRHKQNVNPCDNTAHLQTVSTIIQSAIQWNISN